MQIDFMSRIMLHDICAVKGDSNRIVHSASAKLLQCFTSGEIAPKRSSWLACKRSAKDPMIQKTRLIIMHLIILHNSHYNFYFIFLIVFEKTFIKFKFSQRIFMH